MDAHYKSYYYYYYLCTIDFPYNHTRSLGLAKLPLYNRNKAKKQKVEMRFRTSECTLSMGDFWDAWWQQTYQVNFHRLRSSERAHMTENYGFYLVSLLPPSVPKSPIISGTSLQTCSFNESQLYVLRHHVDNQVHNGCAGVLYCSLSVII